MTLDEVLSQNLTKLTPQYEEFARAKDSCRKCSLYGHYKHVGQSEGNAKNPTFMFVGESLGSDEVEQYRPFIGRAGQRLRFELRKYPNVFNKNSTLISNVLPCRPQNNVFPDDSRSETYAIQDGNRLRPVKARELVGFCCQNWLYREIQMVKPRVLVTLGSKSLEYIRGVKGISANRGTWNFVDRLRVWSFSTFHPSYVLRCQNDRSKDFVVQQFEEDISRISISWSDVVEGDDRMKMSDEEWRREKALTAGISKRIFRETPITEL